MGNPATLPKPGADSVVRRRGPDDPRVLSFGQQRLWYLEQLAEGNPVYNVPFCSRLRGSLDAGVLQKALDAIVQRHEVLRTVILPVRGMPRPLLLKKWAVELKQIDLRTFPESEREERARQCLMAEVSRPFDLMRDLMLRCALIRLADDEYVFLHTAPHLAFEGASIGILYRELDTLYAAFLVGQPSLLPEPALQYADFAWWQRRYLTGPRLETLSRYWKQQLAGAPALELPLDFPRPSAHTMRGKRHFFSMPGELLTSASLFFEQNKTSRYCGLLAAFHVFLYSWAGATDVSVGSPFGLRCSGIEDLIGFFVNTVVLRTVLSGKLTFRELMARVTQTVRDAIANCDLTFDKIVEAVQPNRDPSRGPLFQVNFRAPKQAWPSLQLTGVQAGRAEYIDNGTSKFDLALEIDSSRGEACYFEYCTDLFKEETIVRAIEDFQQLLSVLIAEPEASLTSILRAASRPGRFERHG